MKKSVSRLLSSVGVTLVMVSSGAFAQETTSENANDADSSEIVVTGTLIRGAPPVGTNQVQLGADAIQEIAPVATNDILASLPQVTNYFNRLPNADLGVSVSNIQIARPNIRNISRNASSSSGTLVLVNGHRIASAGVTTSSPDPDMVPVGAIQRVDVNTEGGSATYGADAVAGVINFITLKRFDGLKVDGHYGFADDYWQRDASVTAGKSWDGGSAWISYSYSENDALFGRDRDYIRFLNYSAQPYVGNDRQCATPNFAVTTTLDANGAVLSSLPISFSRCDNIQDKALVPYAERHGAMAGLTQSFGDSTTLDAHAYYSRRKTNSPLNYTASTPVNGNNPWAASVALPPGTVIGPGTITFPGFGTFPTTTSATVDFNLNPLLGPSTADNTTFVEGWGFDAELTQEFGKDWRVRGLFNYSGSDSNYHAPQISQQRLVAASAPAALLTQAQAFNPFDVTLNSPTLIADLLDNEIAGRSKDKLLQLRLIADGALFAMPGGDVKVAVGAEYMHDTYQTAIVANVRLNVLDSTPLTKYKRQVKSVFGEIQVPLISDGNGGSMLTVAGSGRYDHYSDFGGTFNPKIGVNFRPASWIGFRGNWGKSFNAPTPGDQLGDVNSNIQQFPGGYYPPGVTPPASAHFALVVQGSVTGLRPQKAETWSAGVDLDPMDGLRISANYYDVNFTDQLSLPSFFSQIYIDNPDAALYNATGLTDADIAAFFNGRPGFNPNLQAQLTSILASANRPIVNLVDLRTSNYGSLRVKGADFFINYQRKTGFGGLDFSLAGNHQFSRKQAASPTAAVVDVLAQNTPKWFLQSTLGADIGNLRGQLSWNYTDGYDIVPTTSVPVQTKVDSFSTVDLFLRYNVPAESGILRDLSFTFNVKNLFDQDPPVLLRSNINENGFANGFTLGRMFVFGVSKKF